LIRPATLADLDAVTDLGLRFVADPHYSRFLSANRDELQAYMARVIGGDGSSILLAHESKVLIGMVGVQSGSHPMSGTPIANELFWYVRQGFRDGTGRQLMKAAEAWARERGAKQLQMTAPDDRIARVYERYGFAKVETTYQKELI
jgi:GNAT superfamily N-acetyltransferase